MPHFRPTQKQQRTQARPWRVGLLFLGLGCSLLGCRANNAKTDLLEAELRTREREIQEARAELEQLRLLAQNYGHLPHPTTPATPGSLLQMPPSPSVLNSPEALGGMQSLTLGTGTGGRDDDGLPGDESLHVVLVPKDAQNQAIKAPGSATIQAFEITAQGLKVPIGRWEIPAAIMVRQWRSNLLSSGYALQLQWDRPPSTSKLRITARFTSLTGQPFEADKDVHVQPLPGIQPALIPAVIGSGTELPPMIVGPSTPTPPQNVEIIPPLK